MYDKINGHEACDLLCSLCCGVGLTWPDVSLVRRLACFLYKSSRVRGEFAVGRSTTSVLSKINFMKSNALRLSTTSARARLLLISDLDSPPTLHLSPLLFPLPADNSNLSQVLGRMKGSYLIVMGAVGEAAFEAKIDPFYLILPQAVLDERAGGGGAPGGGGDMAGNNW